jgi:DNA-binding MurR/RpiR family transcriptional regulator
MEAVVTRIEERAGELTRSERRIAETVLADPGLLAFATVAQVGERAGTSGATVVRFADRLGYEGWADLQASARASLDRLRPASVRIREVGVDDVLGATAAREADNVVRTLDAVDRRAFDRAVRLLADRKRSVLVLAGAAEDGIGTALHDALDLLRPAVGRLSGSPVAVASRIAHVDEGDVLVAIDLRRYERWVVEAASQATGAGALLVSLTDSPLSPLAELAEVSFTVTAEGAGPFDSHVGTLALANALVTGVAERLRRPATDRLDRIEEAWQTSDTLVDR